MAEIKVGAMTLLSSVPDNAEIYVVVPGDPTPYKTTKADLLSGISAGFFPDGSSIADWTLMVDAGEFFFKRNDGTTDQIKLRIESDGISFYDDAGNFKFWIKKPVSGTSNLVAPETTGDETIATKEWVSIITNEKADLVGGVIPSSQLPSFVDDIIEGYKSGSSFYRYPDFTSVISPDTGKIYIDLVAGQKYKQYRWTSGAGYVQISNGFIASTDDVPEAANLYFTLARVLATQLTGLPTLSGDVIEEDSILNAIAKLKSGLALKASLTSTPRMLKSVFTGNAVTGTETVVGYCQVGGIGLGSAFSLKCFLRSQKSNTTSQGNLKFHLNSSPDLSGSPVQIAVNASTSAIVIPLERTFSYSGGNLYGWPSANNAPTDVANSTVAETVTTVDMSTTRYLIATLQTTGTAGSTLNGRDFKVIVEPNVS